MAIQTDPYFIIPIFKSCSELVSLYPRNNPALEEKMKGLVGRAADIMLTKPQLTIAFEKGGIIINSIPINHNQLKRPQANWFMELAGKNQVGAFVILKALTDDDLFDLGKIFNEASQKRIGFKTIEEQINQHCRECVQVLPLGVQEITPESEKTETHSSSPEPEPKKDIDQFKGNLQPTQAVSGGRLFQLSESDRLTLSNHIRSQIQMNYLGQLFQTLIQMLKDMNTFDQESSFLGLNSFNVSISLLMEMNQVEILTRIHSELFNILPGIPRDDIFGETIELHAQILKFFRSKQLSTPYLNGIGGLAKLSKIQKMDRKLHIQNSINSLMDPKMTSFFLGLSFQNHPLKESCKKLFSNYSTEMAGPLFRLLFHSESRIERKTVLSYLTSAGEAIQPMLLDRLRESIRRQSPWFVKRNLLFLLCKFPSNDLAPMIEDLGKETHPRLQEQLLQACLRLKGPKSVEYGTKMVDDLAVEKIQSVLHVIEQVQNKAYDQVLIKKFHETDDDQVQIKLMRTLQELDTSHSRRFFEDILSARKMVSFRYSGKLRGEAAKCLSKSEHGDAFRILYLFKDDRETEVRQWAKKFVAEKSANGQ